MKNIMTAVEIKKAVEAVTNKIMELSAETQVEFMLEVAELKAGEFLNDKHLIGYLENRIAWHQAFEA